MTADDTRQAAREALLAELTQIPTAAGVEDRVIAFVDAWIGARTDRVHAERDDAGNVLVWQRRRPAGIAPILFTAHLDHPAFVVTGVASDGTVALEFRGGVNDPYFEGAALEFIGPGDARAHATIRSLDAAAKPFKTVTARMPPTEIPAWLAAGCIARWSFPRAEVIDGCIHTDACDDLAAAAAALAAFDELLDAPGCGHVGLLFTVAEEVGFIGTIHAARTGFVPRDARLLCLENSRSFPHDSPIGAGAILRVGDRISVFTPELTNRLAELYADAAKKDPAFRWQRKLMPGGACEATAFASYGYRSTCLCLPLGNYHNMVDIDGVAAGKAKAKVGPEFISVSDFHGLVTMLEVTARRLDDATIGSTEALMEKLWNERGFIVGGPGGSR
jgi:endoglucanase